MAEDNYMPPKHGREQQGDEELTPQLCMIAALSTRLLLQRGIWNQLFLPDDEIENIRGIRIEAGTFEGKEGYIISPVTHSEVVGKRVAAMKADE